MASFILWWFIIQRGGFLHSAFATVGMTMLVRLYGFAHCFHNVSRCTAFPSSGSPSGEPASPRGSSCTVSGDTPFESNVILSGRPPERHTGRSLRFRWWGDPFIRTGCVRNVVWRWIIAATLRNTIQPYRLYSECGVVPFWAVFFLHIHFTVLLPFRGFRLYMGAV